MKYKILVIDDDDGVLDVVNLVLTEEGFDVEVTNKGCQGIAMAKKIPDLIILDILLPGEDGIEICKLLKSRKRTCHIPIIMFSAHSRIDEAVRNSGADGFLPKPFDIDVLLALVKKHLKLETYTV